VDTGREGGGAPTEVGAKAQGLSNQVLLALIWLLGASGFLLLLWGSKLTFFLDDWEFLLYRRDFDADAILAPHGEHIVALPVLIYKALLATFGMSSALPFRAVSTGLFLLSAALLFLYLRRPLGDWPALAGVTIVLFLGAAWEDLLWSFQIGYFGAMATGLGALLALDRGGRRADVLACVLLVIAVLFSSLGLPFAVAAAVQVLVRPDRWRRLWVFAIPLAVYALWWVGWGHDAESALSAANVAKTPVFVLNGIAASLASLFGLATPIEGAAAGGLEWGRPLAVIAICVAIWRIFRIGRVPTRLWIVLALGGSFWILAGFNQMPGRDPTSSRYQYLGVIFLLLIVAELLRGLRLPPRVKLGTTILVLAVAAASVASNVYYLNQAWANSYHPISRLEKASLGSLDIAAATVDPGFVLTEEVAGTGYVHVDAGSYLSAAEEYGSPGYNSEEIAESSESVRFTADKVLFGALGIGLAAYPSPPNRAPVEAAPDAKGVIPIAANACVTVPSDGTATPLLRLPRAGVEIEAETDPIETVKLKRFAGNQFSVEIENDTASGSASELAIPPDRSTVPWKMQLETAGPATVCGRAE
jgi:hypothetical protein